MVSDRLGPKSELMQPIAIAEIMDSKLKTMALDTSRPGESLNVAEGQRRRPTSRPFEQTIKPAQSMRGTGECRYFGTQHRHGRDQCPAFGKSCRSCGTPNHFAKVCMKRGQNTRQLHTMDAPSEEDQHSNEHRSSEHTG